MRNVLDEAKTLIYGDRHQSYGEAKNNFKRIANLVNAFLEGDPISEQNFGIVMALVKFSRQRHSPKRDNITDAIGYLALQQDVLDEAQEANKETSFFPYITEEFVRRHCMPVKESTDGTEANHNASSDIDSLPPGRRSVESSIRATRHDSPHEVSR